MTLKYLNILWASGPLNASHNSRLRRRLDLKLRCKFTRCATATRRRFLAILAICITIVASSKFLVEDHKSVSGSDKYSVGAFDEYSAVQPSSETTRLRSSGPVANSDASEAKKSYSPNPRLPPERFNAALAAGLIDPSRIEFVKPIVWALRPAGGRAIPLRGPEVSVQNPDRGMESGTPRVTVAVVTPTAPTAANPTDAVSSLAGQGTKSSPHRQDNLPK